MLPLAVVAAAAAAVLHRSVSTSISILTGTQTGLLEVGYRLNHFRELCVGRHSIVQQILLLPLQNGAAGAGLQQ